MKTAQVALDHVRALIAIADSDDDHDLDRIAELLEQVADEKAPLPDVEDTRRRFRAGLDLIGRRTVGEWLD